MLEFARSDLPSRVLPDPKRVVVAGVGNAGVALLDRLTVNGVAAAGELVAFNTDQASLGASVAANRLVLGPKTARGLGAGGDPDLGAEAAEESSDEIREAIGGADVLLLCAGLGGGCGSGAAPEVARIAAGTGVPVVALVTRPFGFEGKRRANQAEDAVLAIADAAAVAFVFENDRMSSIAEPLAGVHETFAAADSVLCDCAAAILRLARAGGPIRVSPGDLLAIFRPGAGPAMFGCGVGGGKNRAHAAVEAALKCPLMDRGRLLGDARSVLVHIDAPTTIPFVEVHAIMDSVAGHLDDDAILHASVGLTDEVGERVVVSILAAAATPAPARAVPPPRRAEPEPEFENVPEPILGETVADLGGVEVFADADAAAEVETPSLAGSEGSSEPAELFNTEAFAVSKPAKGRAKPKAKQETLGLDSVTKGRFEKSEPTIVGGEDLDVPTFLRQKVRLK